MRIAHLSWLLSRNGGGIPPVVFAVVREQRALGHESAAIGVADPSDAVGDAMTFRAIGPLALGLAPGMGNALAARAPDLLHLHGLFTWPSNVARTFGRRTNRPVIVSPHGMLEPWALANSAWKKRLFRLLIEDANLRGAACLHALCAAEAAQIRRLGFTNPIAVVPNGVELPIAASATTFVAAFPRARGRRIVLFLGRVHPKKGLPHLIDAWAQVKRDRRALDDWMLVIAGPDQRGHAAEVTRRVAERGLGDDIQVIGPLYGELKESALAAAAAFILPSFSEGFSIAILEAMARRLPVLVTRQCNVDVEACGAGLLADPDERSVAAQLHAFLDMSDVERSEMGSRGRREVEARYTWPRVARELLDAYEFVLGESSRPAFVETAA